MDARFGGPAHFGHDALRVLRALHVAEKQHGRHGLTVDVDLRDAVLRNQVRANGKVNGFLDDNGNGRRDNGLGDRFGSRFYFLLSLLSLLPALLPARSVRCFFLYALRICVLYVGGSSLGLGGAQFALAAIVPAITAAAAARFAVFSDRSVFAFLSGSFIVGFRREGFARCCRDDGGGVERFHLR